VYDFQPSWNRFSELKFLHHLSRAEAVEIKAVSHSDKAVQTPLHIRAHHRQ
jgi:hypothetical protein